MKTSFVAALIAISLAAQSGGAEEKQVTTTKRASGTFEVKVEPIADRTTFGRLSLRKQFQGDLVGSSIGEMMTEERTEKGSGAYVAIERFTGSLDGRKGSFALVHSGTMRRGGEFNLIIRVVPDSGTGELAGLTGTMEIVIKDRDHFYHLDYTLPATP